MFVEAPMLMAFFDAEILHPQFPEHKRTRQSWQQARLRRGLDEIFQLLRWSRKILFFTQYVTKGFAEKLGSIVHEYITWEYSYDSRICVEFRYLLQKETFFLQLLFLALGCTQCLFKSGLGGASGRMESSTNSTGKGHQLIEIGSLKGRQFLTQHQWTVNTTYIKWRFVVSPNRH